MLRLPSSRRSGPDPLKLSEQIARFGDRVSGMPPIQVTECAGGEYMINDGVTRAFRIAKLRPGSTITAEVIEERPQILLHHLPRLRERL